MNLRKAQKLLREDILSLSLEQLQKYKADLVTAWYYAKGEYGYQNDFFVYLPEVKAYVPADKWMLQNINARMDEVDKELKERECA